MTLAEFKAWLEGFEHSFSGEAGFIGAQPGQFDGAKVTGPSHTQWLLIKEKLALVSQSPLSIPQVQVMPNGQKASDWYKTYIQNLPQNAAVDRVLSGQAL